MLLFNRGSASLQPTFHIPSKKYTDYGAIFYPKGSIPTYLNSIAVDFQDNICALARIKTAGGEIQDLVQIGTIA